MSDAKIVWGDAEREAVFRAIWEVEHGDTVRADAALTALAPFVAAREAAAFKRGAEAAREQVAHWADAELCDCELADAIRLLPHDLPEDKQ
jgi:hypothetical protein